MGATAGFCRKIGAKSCVQDGARLVDQLFASIRRDANCDNTPTPFCVHRPKTVHHHWAGGICSIDLVRKECVLDEAKLLGGLFEPTFAACKQFESTDCKASSFCTQQNASSTCVVNEGAVVVQYKAAITSACEAATANSTAPCPQWCDCEGADNKVGASPEEVANATLVTEAPEVTSTEGEVTEAPGGANTTNDSGKSSFREETICGEEFISLTPQHHGMEGTRNNS